DHYKMDVSELNVQKFTLIIPHKKEELGQVHQNDTNKDIEQVELSDTTEPQNLESK
ncbi:3830_t:CDS:2, partial [Rhizophagus irregularis]